jgi:hypothetical protein
MPPGIDVPDEADKAATDVQQLMAKIRIKQAERIGRPMQGRQAQVELAAQRRGEAPP